MFRFHSQIPANALSSILSSTWHIWKSSTSDVKSKVKLTDSQRMEDADLCDQSKTNELLSWKHSKNVRKAEIQNVEETTTASMSVLMTQQTEIEFWRIMVDVKYRKGHDMSRNWQQMRRGIKFIRIGISAHDDSSLTECIVWMYLIFEFLGIIDNSWRYSLTSHLTPEILDWLLSFIYHLLHHKFNSPLFVDEQKSTFWKHETSQQRIITRFLQNISLTKQVSFRISPHSLPTKSNLFGVNPHQMKIEESTFRESSISVYSVCSQIISNQLLLTSKNQFRLSDRDLSSQNRRFVAVVVEVGVTFRSIWHLLLLIQGKTIKSNKPMQKIWANQKCVIYCPSSKWESKITSAHSSTNALNSSTPESSDSKSGICASGDGNGTSNRFAFSGCRCTKACGHR
jgi:hypothetical protein